MILTLADIGQKKLTILGPAGTRSFVDSAQAGGFMHRPELQLNTVDIVYGMEAEWDAPVGVEITPIVASTAAAAAADAPQVATAAGDGVEPPAKRAASGEPSPDADAAVDMTDAPPVEQSPEVPVQLFVGNLSYTVDEAGLQSAFERFGGASHVKIIMDRQTGKPRGFGFVTLRSESAANAAIELSSMGLVTLDGRPLRMNLSDRGGSGSGGGDGGWSMGAGESLPGMPPPPTGTAVSYICQLPTSRGKFNKARAVELGVKVGPDFGKLAAGMTVTTGAGVKVKPEDVVGETVVGACMFVAACPTLAALASLSGKPGVAALCPTTRQHPLFVVHLTPARVAGTAEYLAWMHSLGPDAQHLLLYTDPASPTDGREMPTFVASATLAAKLSALNPSFFTWPAADFALAPTSQLLLTPPPGAPATTTMGQSALRVVLSPAVTLGVDTANRTELCKNIAASLDKSELSDWMKAAEGVQDAVTAVATSTAASVAPASPVCTALSSAGRGNGEILFLGTGSASPSKYRNVSGILVSLPTGGLMMDCGEGTYGQLVRRFGSEGTATLLRRMRCIYVTHMHADHHLGITELLSNRRAAFAARRNSKPEQEAAVGFGPAAAWPWWPWSDSAPPPGVQAAAPEETEHPDDDDDDNAEDIMIVAPSQLGQWVRRYHGTVEEILPENGTATFCPNSALTPDAWRRRHSAQRGQNSGGFEAPAAREARERCDAYMGGALGVTLRCCDVDHPAFASGVIITANTTSGATSTSTDGPAGPIPWKLVYTGDTRPCRQLTMAGQGATILIHEATMENDLDEMAQQKRHSTTAEAVGDGMALKAERTILTHFSQRYPKLSPWMDMAAAAAAKRAAAEVAAAEAAAAAAPTVGAEMLCAPVGTAPAAAAGATPAAAPAATNLLQGVGGASPPPGVSLPPGVSQPDASHLERQCSEAEGMLLQEYYEQQTGVAFDLMTVNFADLLHMPGLKPAIRSFFEVEEPELTAADIECGACNIVRCGCAKMETFLLSSMSAS